MTIVRLASVAALVLFCACASSNAGTPPPKDAKTASVDADRTAPTPPPAEEGESGTKGMPDLPPGWMFGSDASGSTIVVHMPDNSAEPDGFVMLGLHPQGGELPPAEADVFRKKLLASGDGCVCEEVSVSREGSRASFTCHKDASEQGVARPTSKMILQGIAGEPPKTMICFGFWKENVHPGHAADLEVICDSIAATVVAGVLPNRSHDVASGDIINADIRPAPPTKAPAPAAAPPISVVTPEGWTFDARSGTGTTKAGADGRSFGRVKMNAVPTLDMTPRQHADMFIASLRPRASTMKAGEPSPSDGDAERIMIPIAVYESADQTKVKTSGFAMVRKVPGWGDRYLLCFGFWSPDSPKLGDQAAALCDSFSASGAP